MNILLVNTNQISIRFVEELLAKNNIHGEIAMVRVGKFALDLVQGMNIDLLVCEIESETKEKTKHFLQESRKMTPAAYYFILMDGESLEYMEEDFLNSLDDFITIPFEDRALKLRMNRGILACIEKKKKADIAFGRPPVKAPVTAFVKPAPQETLHAKNVSPEKPVEFQDITGLSEQEPVPEKKDEPVSGSVTSAGRKVPREEFQYEPSYEELLQQRNKNLRKEKEAAWLQAMSSQISSYAPEEESERPIRIREEKKPESLNSPNAESQSAIQNEPEILVDPAQHLPLDPESSALLTAKPIHEETPEEKAAKASAASYKSKSKVKSFFESLSKLKAISISQTLQPLLASSGAGSDGSEAGKPPYSTPEPLEAPESGPEPGQESTFSSEVPAAPHSGSPSVPSSESPIDPFSEPSNVPPDEPSDEPSIAPPAGPARETVPEGTESPLDPENPAPSDDVIPEESFLELPVTDEEFVQEVPPLVPEAGQMSTSASGTSEAAQKTTSTSEVPGSSPSGSPEEPSAGLSSEPPTQSFSEPPIEPISEPPVESPIVQSIESSEESLIEPAAQEAVSSPDPDLENPIPSDDVIPEESFLGLPVTDEEYVQEVPPSIPAESLEDEPEKASVESLPFAGQVSKEEAPDGTVLADAPIRHAPSVEDAVVETSPPQESGEEPIDLEAETEETVPADGDTEVKRPEDELSEELHGRADMSVEVGRPSAPPVTDTPMQSDFRMVGNRNGEDLIFEPDPVPTQVPHIQDEIWMDPADTLFLEPDDCSDDTDELSEDIIEEEEIFSSEENSEISLDTIENPIMEDVLIMSLEDEGIAGSPETLPETPSPSTAAEAESLDERKSIQEDSDGPSGSLPQDEDSIPVATHPEIPEEEVPEPTGAAPKPEEIPVPPKKESMDLRQYLKESEETDAKDLKSTFRKVFGKRFPS